MIQTLRDNCPDANRIQKLDSSAMHPWAVLLAGCDGVRLRDLTRRIAGDSRPKQFCRIIGEVSLFRETCTRLDPLFIRDHQVFVFFAPTNDIMALTYRLEQFLSHQATVDSGHRYRQHPES